MAAVDVIRVAHELFGSVTKVFRGCLKATGMKVVYKLKLQRLTRKYDCLVKRFEKFDDLYYHDCDRYRAEIRSEMDGLSDLYDDVCAVFIKESKKFTGKSLFFQEAFSTNVNNDLYQELEKVCDDFSAKLDAIEKILKDIAGPIILHPDALRPTSIDPNTITVESSKKDTNLNITWKDHVKQIEKVKQYQIEAIDLSGSTKPRFYIVEVPTSAEGADSKSDSESIKPVLKRLQSTTADESEQLKVLATALRPFTTYAVSISKIFHDKQRSNWSMDCKKYARTGHLYPEVPQATKHPFESPEPGSFTISVCRPENFMDLNITKCKIRAFSTDPYSRYHVYNQTRDVKFDAKNKAYTVKFNDFQMTGEFCRFELHYVDSIDGEERTSQRGLVLEKKIGSLTPGKVTRKSIQFIKLKKHLSWKMIWGSPTNAGAIEKYVVLYGKYKKHGSTKLITKEVGDSKKARAVRIQFLKPGCYKFQVKCVNYDGKESLSRVKTYYIS